MNETRSIGDRLREARKRRGLTQRELARLSGVSLSYIRKLEQGDYDGGVRLETAHKLARILGVLTSALVAGPDAREPEQGEVDQWEPTRQALEGVPAGEATGEELSLAGLEDGVRAAVSAVLGSRYAELCLILPGLLRDADALVAMSAGEAQRQARRLRSRIRQVTAYMMGQTWQFEVANDAIELAISDAGDELTEVAAADWKCWALLRQGRLAETAELATQWAADTKPRMSSATPAELTAWGRFLILVSTAAVRDNRPGEADEALRLARMAAAGLGRDIIPGFNPWQVFGPATVAMVQAENAMVMDQPSVTLGIGSRMVRQGFPVPRNYLRHRLDVASAHASVRQYPEAVAVLHDIRGAAPEWLAQQRYAADILGRVIGRRRSLTPEMRDLAAFLRLPL
ncbi:MAG TPA: helix-turn-helix transcriptional regulator [Streptosporangiaceae bacterium]|nr:helix-turn-helix transcriptional regulator [Streptosporangiaceae bacterium]